MSDNPIFHITGGQLQSPISHLREVRVGEYTVTVALSPFNEFLGIVEVAQNADFRSFEQRMRNSGVHNVEQFYRPQE